MEMPQSGAKVRPKSAAFLAQVGKGRKKGVKNRVTLVKEVAAAIVKSAAMDKHELLERLSRQARADIGMHLKITDGVPQPYIDAENTDTIREITIKRTIKRTAGEDGVTTETKLKVADPRPALVDIAEIYGMKKTPEDPATKGPQVLVQILNQAGVTKEQLRVAVKAALRLED
jgi:hypothetical protein